MKKLILALFLVIFVPSAASAREAWHDWCYVGAKKVITSGLQSTTTVQASQSGCVVTVYRHGAGLATLYADNNNTPLANPFTAQLNGEIIWYADDSRYDQTTTLTVNGQQIITTVSDILLCDPFVAGAVCGAGSGGGSPHNLLSTTHLDTIPHSPPVRGDLITGQVQISPAGTNPSWAALALGTNGQVLMSTGLDAIWGNLTAGTGITINSVSGTTTISTSGGGSGCTLPGTDQGVLTEHPVGTCYNSANATWDDHTPSSSLNGGILQFSATGLGNTITAASGGHNLQGTYVFGYLNTVTPLAADDEMQFVFGRGNTVIGCNDSCVAMGRNITIGSTVDQSNVYVMGNQTTVDGNGALYSIGQSNTLKGGTGFDGYVMGTNNSINSTNAGVLNETMYLGFTSTWTLGGANSQMVDVELLGGFDNLTVNNTSSGTNQLNCIHGVGGSSTFTVSGSPGSNAITSVSYVGKTNSFTVNGANMLRVVVAGNNNTATGALTDGYIFGKTNTLNGCSNCAAVGFNANLSANNTLTLGMSATDIGLQITNSGGTHDNVRRTPMVFASLPACAAGTDGSFAAVTDSSTNTPGATITGSGSNHVFGYCNATNWIVVGTSGSGAATVVASGTSALGTGAISSGTCATVVTTGASGALTTDNLSADFNADPTSTTGYQPSASGMLTIIKYITANNVNFKVCNNTSGSITPGAVTLQWRVIR